MDLYSQPLSKNITNPQGKKTDTDTHLMEDPSICLEKVATANMERDLTEQLSTYFGPHILRPIGFSFRTSPQSPALGWNFYFVICP